MKAASDLKEFKDLKEFENEMAHVQHQKTVKGLMLKEDFKTLRYPLLTIAGAVGLVVALFAIQKIRNSKIKVSITTS